MLWFAFTTSLAFWVILAAFMVSVSRHAPPACECRPVMPLP
jgi:hypothetical protein